MFLFPKDVQKTCRKDDLGSEEREQGMGLDAGAKRCDRMGHGNLLLKCRLRGMASLFQLTVKIGYRLLQAVLKLDLRLPAEHLLCE